MVISTSTVEISYKPVTQPQLILTVGNCIWLICYGFLCWGPSHMHCCRTLTFASARFFVYVGRKWTNSGEKWMSWSILNHSVRSSCQSYRLLMHSFHCMLCYPVCCVGRTVERGKQRTSMTNFVPFITLVDFYPNEVLCYGCSDTWTLSPNLLHKKIARWFLPRYKWCDFQLGLWDLLNHGNLSVFMSS